MKNVKVYKKTYAKGHLKDDQIYVEWLDENNSLLTSTGDVYDGELSAYDEDGDEVLISDPDVIEVVAAEIADFEAKELFKLFEKEPTQWKDGVYISKDNNPIYIYKIDGCYKYIPTNEKGVYDVYDKDENYLGAMTLTDAEVHASDEVLNG